MTVSSQQLDAIAELSRRKCESLNLFRALPHQVKAFRNTGRELLLRGGNRCQPRNTKVFRLRGGLTTLGKLRIGDRILGIRDTRKRVDSQFVTVIGKTEFTEKCHILRTKRGYRTEGTHDHPVWAREIIDGECLIDRCGWFEMSQLRVGMQVLRYCGQMTIMSNSQIADIDETSLEPSRQSFVWDEIESIEEGGERKFVGITTDTGCYIGDGFVCHNSGKSIVGAVRFAAIAMDKPVYGPDGGEIDMRLPWQKNRPLTMWCVGLGQGHIGQTLYRLLFRPGAFRIIRDAKTGEWRSFRPWSPLDVARARSSKQSPPLIPPRYLNPAGWGWENKAEKVFTQCEVWNPETHATLANIYAFTSSGDVKAGDPIDEIWVDERIKYPQYYAEWQARLIDNKGRLTWTSWPDITNFALMDVSRRAKEAENDEHPQVVELVFKTTQNPHLEAESVQTASAGYSDEERRARIEGEYVTDTLRMYANFDPEIHRAITRHEEDEDELSRILRARGGEPPPDWTRELILDPGTSYPGVLLCAIPPDELGEYMVPYREIYTPRLTADVLAERVHQYTQGYFFERFIIDPNAGRQTPMGFNVTVAKNYSRAFEDLGLRCRQSGSLFTPGSNDVSGRILTLQSWMTIGPSGKPKLRIVTDHCPNLCQQLERYVKDVMSNVPTEFKPAKGQKLDIAVCLEYWASRDPRWIPPPAGGRVTSPMQRLYKQFCKTYGKKKSEPESIVLGPTKG